MVAQELDKLWEGWMVSLSTSYEKTLDLLEANKPTEAAAEYRKGFLLTVKRLYSEAAKTSPVRFEKIDDWSGWTRQLYVLSAKASKALQKEPSDVSQSEARKLLAALREHFYKLHEKTGTLKATDHIYAFQQQALKAKPNAERLRALRKALDETPPPAKALKSLDGYLKAKAGWAEKVDRIVADGAIDPNELETLRSASAAFYRAYGRSFN